MKKKGVLILGIVFICFFDVSLTNAQEKSPASDIAELAKQSQNPVANMYQVPITYLGDFNSGSSKQYISTLMLKPVIPISISPKLLLIFRSIIPVSYIPSPENKTGLGDIQFQFYLSPVNKSKFIWGLGPLVSVPSGIPPEMCSGKWTAGPAGAGLFMFKHLVVGALITQRWSFAGNSTMPEINQFYINAFANYNFKHGWAIGYSPELYFNWNLPYNAWNFPLGLNASKVFRIGKQPVSASISYFYNIIRPENYTNMYIKAGFTFLFPRKENVKQK